MSDQPESYRQLDAENTAALLAAYAAVPDVAERIAQAIEAEEARAGNVWDRTGDPYFGGQADGLQRAAAIAREHGGQQ